MAATSLFSSPITSLNLKSGFSIPKIGLGTWGIGGFAQADFSNDTTEIESLQKAFYQGLKHVDLAEFYGAGHTEELVGQALTGFKREQFFLTSKVLPANASYDNLLKAAEGSLQRLKTDYLDLYLLHGPSLEIPIAETMLALNKLKAEGIIKNIGVSNFSPERLSEAQRHSPAKILVNQVQYNLQEREAEDRGVLRYCQENDLALIAWRPLALGSLSNNESNILSQIAKKHSATNAQIALAWLVSQDNVGTIFKCSNPQHLLENLGSLKIILSPEEIELLRKDFPNQIKIPKRPLL